MDPLIRKRSVIKARLTKFEAMIDDLSQRQNEITALEYSELSRRIHDTGNLLCQFEQIQLQIDETQSVNPDEVSDQLIDFESKFYAVMSKADVLLKPPSPPTSPVLGPSQRPYSPVSSVSSVNNTSQLKLPAIKIPSFDGNPAQWINFKDMFSALIHSNDNLSDVEKMTYLISSLKGEGLEALGGLNVSASNYSIAWNTLCSRYDSSRSLIFYHIKEIFNMDQLSKESAKGLRGLVDTLRRNVRALQSFLKEDEFKDSLLMYILQGHIDPHTAKEFEAQLKAESVPSLEELLNFVERKSALLETIEARTEKPQRNSNNSAGHNKPIKCRSFPATVNTACVLCNQNHLIANCDQFLALGSRERWDKAKQLRLCLNCLAKSHFSQECRSKILCKICQRRHHSCLHFERASAHAQLIANSARTPPAAATRNSAVPVIGNPESHISDTAQPLLNISAFAAHSGNVLLPTAQVVVYDENGKPHYTKALIDSGSMSSFVTADFCKRLRLQERPTNVRVSGITMSSTTLNTYCQVNMHSVTTGFLLKADCVVIPKITPNLPLAPVRIEGWEIPSDFILADPAFHVSSDIDILIGSDYLWSLFRSGQYSLGRQRPFLQETVLGWLVSGPMPFVTCNSVSLFCKVTTTGSDIDNTLSNFWELEEVPSTKLLTKEERFCENHFLENTVRNDSGRFVVRIPFKGNPDQLGDSLDSAKRRFLSLERKLAVNAQLRERYVDFMQEYEDLGHMSSVTSASSETSVFLPHHGVLKEESLSTKLRVVFDGSSSTTTGMSLNQLQAVGPVIQSDLFSILVRFRTLPFVFSADVHKMYRQIVIAEDERRFQRILWRPSPDLPIKIFNLNTVTYGTSSASFLATRCLYQIGIDCMTSHPDMSRIILQDFYVDDVLSGARSLSEAQSICTMMNSVFSSYGFPLCKWLSNEPSILVGLDKSEKHPNLYEFSSTCKTLGLLWSNLSDTLVFSISQRTFRTVTKRSMLSEIAQLFDPLGLVQPCTMKSKFLLQQLWLEKIEWDDCPSSDVVNEWLEIKSQLPLLNKFSFPRHAICKDPKSISLHAFSDASLKGYGSCVYIRSVLQDDSVFCHLLCAKGKVAPLRPMTIPRLELCGAVTMVKLVQQVLFALNVNFDDVVFWTDSTILLCWLKMHPNKLSTFVANRISLIQELSINAHWRHVGTHSNPSDLISRGSMPSDLVTSSLWLHGPDWILLPETDWPVSKFDVSDVPEIKPSVSLLAHSVSSSDAFLISSFSTLKGLKRVAAYSLRFISNCRKPSNDRQFGPLSLPELNSSINALIKISQEHSFSAELEAVASKRPFKSSQLRNLDPFLSPDGILLVGGRLKFSSYPFSKRHPAILHANHHLSKLLVESEHLRLLHAGPQHMLASLRERYWIIGGRNLCKKVSRTCVTCFRHSPKSVNPIMGNLPSCRVERSYTFQHTGLDFCGPFLVKDKKGRGSKNTKCYICVFICLATKAIHLELVSSLTTDSFLQCLRRFVSRRGKPSDLYSDNGSNFVGARSLLQELGGFLRNNEKTLTTFAVDNELVWHFIPSYSPHFGGIWERAVRSAKNHLRRVVGNNSFVFEDFITLLAQIECVLNSRPLTPLSCAPEDLTPLTPGHFLIGHAMCAVPESDVVDVNPNRLDRFQHVQQLAQHFWQRWSQEYLQLLQQRHKWQGGSPELPINTMVLLKQNRLPPLHWRLGRIVELHPGKDGVSRVASVRTSSGVVRRAIATLCPLPLDEQ